MRLGGAARSRRVFFHGTLAIHCASGEDRNWHYLQWPPQGLRRRLLRAAAEDRDYWLPEGVDIAPPVWRPPIAATEDRNYCLPNVAADPPSCSDRRTAAEDRNLDVEGSWFDNIFGLRPPLMVAGDRNDCVYPLPPNREQDGGRRYGGRGSQLHSTRQRRWCRHLAAVIYGGRGS